jgi:hypothetical protein
MSVHLILLDFIVLMIIMSLSPSISSTYYMKVDMKEWWESVASALLPGGRNRDEYLKQPKPNTQRPETQPISQI